jgi:hypothetical protein
VGALQVLQQQKIEELMLYVIELQKQLETTQLKVYELISK